MCNGCYGYYEAEDVSEEDREAFFKEKEAILEAKLATVRHLKQMLGKKSDSDKK